MPCLRFLSVFSGNVVPLNLTIFNLRRNLVILTWPKVQSADERQILSYVINYREVYVLCVSFSICDMYTSNWLVLLTGVLNVNIFLYVT